MPRVTCIIPAYNEAARIGKVLEAACAHPLINEVIVVDDASTDGTAAVVRKFPSVRFLSHAANRGKSAALHSGYAAMEGASDAFVLFLDADLVGLTPENLTDLITPVLDGSADVGISLRGNCPWVWRMIGIDYISGERVMKRDLLAPYMEGVSRLSGFGFEVFLNRLIIRERKRIRVASWKNVGSPYKLQKFGFFKGVRADWRMMRDIFKTVSPFEAVGQIVAMIRLRK